MVTNTKRPLTRWFRISLRTLLLVMLICGVVSGWVGAKRRQSQRQADAIAALVELHATRIPEASHIHSRFGYENYLRAVATYDSGPLGKRRPKGQQLPGWLRHVTGEECFHRVLEVHLAAREINDADLIQLLSFRDGNRHVNGTHLGAELGPTWVRSLGWC